MAQDKVTHLSGVLARDLILDRLSKRVAYISLQHGRDLGNQSLHGRDIPRGEGGGIQKKQILTGWHFSELILKFMQ